MKTICFTLITASAIIFYSSVTSTPNYIAKISVSIPDLNDNNIKGDIDKEVQSLEGIQSQSINLDTKTLEMLVDINLFSIDEFKDSFDLMGISYEDPKVENVYY